MIDATELPSPAQRHRALRRLVTMMPPLSFGNAPGRMPMIAASPSPNSVRSTSTRRLTTRKAGPISVLPPISACRVPGSSKSGSRTSATPATTRRPHWFHVKPKFFRDAPYINLAPGKWSPALFDDVKKLNRSGPRSSRTCSGSAVHSTISSSASKTSARPSGNKRNLP